MSNADDCAVHVTWWAPQRCGTSVDPAVTWSQSSKTVVARLRVTGKPTACGEQQTRADSIHFETVIDQLDPGAFTFETGGQSVVFDVWCLKGRSP